jgi:hypothetical protein
MAGGTPKFDLAEVKRLAQDYLAGRKASDGKRAIRFTAPSRSTEAVITVLYCTVELANRKIATGLLSLEGKDFSERKLQWSEVFDVYGLEAYEGHNWYVKFCIAVEDGGVEYVEEVSFHPLEQVMVLADGRTLAVTYQPGDKE